jgi:hypothetical protein
VETLTLAGIDIDGSVIAMVAIVGGLGIAVISIISSTIKSTYVGRAREESRREIAAYIAEGSMSPEEGERLMKAGPKDSSGCC